MMIAAIFAAVVAIFVLIIREHRPLDDEGMPLLDQEFSDWVEWDWPGEFRDWREDWE